MVTNKTRQTITWIYIDNVTIKCLEIGKERVPIFFIICMVEFEYTTKEACSNFNWNMRQHSMTSLSQSMTICFLLEP
jgi:hypothetical protein